MSATLSELAASWGEFQDERAGRRHVLVVDDDRPSCAVFATALEAAGFTTESAPSGAEALKRVEPGRFDAVLVDKNLPDIDGIKVVRFVQQQDSDCEAVIITGYANLDSILAAIDLRAADYLLKPLESIEILPAVMTRAIRRRNRRLLARRMLADLRGAVKTRADDATLPLIDDARRRVEEFTRSLQKKRRVLVAEHEAGDLDRPLEGLTRRGLRIAMVPSGEEAWVRCVRGEVDVLIVSDRFADTSGLDLVDRILETDHRPELVFVTERAGFEDALAAVARGATAYIIKPIADTDGFCRTVERALRNHHERLYHYKMVKELYAVVAALENKTDHTTRRRISQTLAEFDVKTAENALEPYDG